MNDTIDALEAIGTTFKQAATAERYQVGNRSRGIRKGDLKAPVSAGRALQKSARAIGPMVGVPTSLGIDVFKTIKNALGPDKKRATRPKRPSRPSR